MDLGRFLGRSQDTLSNSDISDIRASPHYFISENGIVGKYPTSTSNNPSPPDFSLYTVPTDPLRIPAGSDVTGIQSNLFNTGLGTPFAFGNGVPLTFPASTGTFDAPEPGASSLSSSEFDNLIRTGGIGTSNILSFGKMLSGSDGKSALNNTTSVSNSVLATSLNGTDNNNFPPLANISLNPVPNELNKFASYTYNIALYMLNSKQYVDLLSLPNNPQQVLSQSLLLMRSGGVGLDNTNDPLNSDSKFFNEFFIDDLDVTCVAVGPSKFKQNTNATDIRFTVIEPRGVTLLEKLQTAAAKVILSNERYIHAPYLLEITFKGYDENGQPVPAPSMPKYIPIRITDITFEVSESGTIYKVEAIPFAHNLFGQIISTIPMNIELSAKNVGEIFNTAVKSFTETTDSERIAITGGGGGGADSGQAAAQRITYGEVGVSLGDILTKNQENRTKPTITTAISSDGSQEEKEVAAQAEKYDTYEFVVASEIANSKLNTDQIYDALKTPVDTGKGKTDGNANLNQFQAYAQSFRGQVSFDKETQVFKINAGTDILKLINLIIMHSSYMEQNVIDPATTAASDSGTQGIKWFKVVPYISDATSAGTGWDGKDGRYKYKIVYAIVPTLIYYHDFPWAPKSKPVGVGVHKIYDYIFSGINTDVTNFKLKFNTAFVQVMTSGTGSPTGLSQNPNDAFVSQKLITPISVEGDTINNSVTLKRARAKDLFSSVMSDGVDMVDLELDIIGDPAYIPTSDAYWQDKIRAGQQHTTAFMPDGTINYDLSPPYIQINLKTPPDYDELSGLANPNIATNSSFSGVYRVTSIDNTFSGGVFSQRIYGFRPPTQPQSGGTGNNTTNVDGTERQLLSFDNLANFTPANLVGNILSSTGISSGSVANVLTGKEGAVNDVNTDNPISLNIITQTLITATPLAPAIISAGNFISNLFK